MTLVRALAGLVIVSAVPLCGQQFEVASIKLSSPDPGSSSGIHTGEGRLDANNVTLKRCIMGAFGLGPHQISGGPDWLDSVPFEISAKTDSPINDDALLMTMLKTLLADRFKLTFHFETKTMPVFILDEAKSGSKLAKAEEGEAGSNTSTTNASTTITAHNTDMDSFARVLARRTELPVINRTGLTGIFNFTLQWAPDNAKLAAGAVPEAPSLFSAIQDQLGLRLRSEKAPVKILIIDHVEKPSAN